MHRWVKDSAVAIEHRLDFRPRDKAAAPCLAQKPERRETKLQAGELSWLNLNLRSELEICCVLDETTLNRDGKFFGAEMLPLFPQQNLIRRSIVKKNLSEGIAKEPQA